MRIKTSALLFLSVVSLAYGLAAQTFTSLYSFTDQSDGGYPLADLALSGTTLYGVTDEAGAGGRGTIFRINTDGTGFTNLHSFDAGSYDSSFHLTNSDGAYPITGLLVSGDTLYGTTRDGGVSGHGTVFSIRIDGSDFTNLHTFLGSDGGDPETMLVLSGDTLYGATLDIGASGVGRLFSIGTNGSGFSVLHTFNGTDGEYPGSTLFLSGDMLYGTGSGGGTGNSGVVFGVHLDGSGYTNIYNFTPLIYSFGYNTNSDGGYPYSGVILSGNTLYGNANVGGPAGRGTIFKVNTDGTGFSTLYRFSTTGQSYTNADGAYPQGHMILVGNTLYGTTEAGGLAGNGTIFAVDTNGDQLTSLYQFSADPSPDYTNSDGADVYAGLILSGNSLYGVTDSGGLWSGGTIFALSLNPVAPQLTIALGADNVVLSWPADSVGFTLQSATNLTPPISWTDIAQTPVTIDGQNVVTNAVGESQQFYRLRQ